MYSQYKFLYSLYKSLGVKKALWTLVRILILPAKKIDSVLPKNGLIFDVGTGQGALANFLTFNSPLRNIIGIDLSKSRINDAKKTVKARKNIRFIYGDALKIKLPVADSYLIVDVLHHIPYQDQKKLLSHIASLLKKDSCLVIKEIDKSNFLPHFFGQIFEKYLYPKERIYARSKNDWLELISSLGLGCKIEKGNTYFPDSTLIFVSKKK